MATTQEDVEAALARIDQAEAALSAAREQQQKIASDPRENALHGEEAKTAVFAAKDKLSEAEKNYNRVKAAYVLEQKKNPDPKNLTPLQQAELDAKKQAIASKMADEEAKQRNAQDPSVGARVDDKTAAGIRKSRAEAIQGKPARNDSPVQREEAATHAATQQEVARSNRAREAQDATETQQQALTTQINATRGLMSDVMQQDTARMRTAQDAQETARAAAQGLLQAQVTMRGQDQNHIQARASFFSSLFNSITSAGLRMMQGLPKGDQTAVKFVRGAFAIMNDMYHQSGLDRELPRPDKNSPEWRALQTLSGTARDRVPTTPPASETATYVAVLSAYMGFPQRGWNGPIGMDALPLLEDLDAARAAQNLAPVGNHGPVTPVTSANPSTTTTGKPGTTAPAAPPLSDTERRAKASLTPEGKNLVLTHITPEIQALAEKKAKDQPLTADEQALLTDRQNKLNAALDTISPPGGTAAPPAQPSAAPPPSQGTADPNRPPTVATTGTLITPGKDLSYAAMYKETDARRKAQEEQGITPDPEYTTAQETLDRLLRGEKPAVTSYNNENDAKTGNSYEWAPKPAPTTDIPKLQGPDTEPSEPVKPAESPVDFMPKMIDTPNLVTLPPTQGETPRPPLDMSGMSTNFDYVTPSGGVPYPDPDTRPPILDPYGDVTNSSNFDFVPPSVEPMWEPTPFIPPEIAVAPPPEPIEMSYDNNDYWQWQQDWMDQQNED